MLGLFLSWMQSQLAIKFLQNSDFFLTDNLTSYNKSSILPAFSTKPRLVTESFT